MPSLQASRRSRGGSRSPRHILLGIYDEAALARGIGIRFKGQQRHDVEEYCRSEGWIRVALGKKVDRHGNPLTLKLSGEVEAWFERPAEGADDAEG